MQQYRRNSLPLAPSPHLEHESSRSLSHLRRFYANLLHEHLSRFPTPKESFNRWLFERSTHPRSERGADPLLPLKFEPLAPTLEVEIVDDIPLKVNKFPKTVQDARNSIAAYTAACRDWLQRTAYGEPLSQHDLDKVKQLLDELEPFSKQETDPQKLIDRLKSVKEDVQPIFHKKIAPLLHKIFSQLADETEKEAKRLAALQPKTLTVLCIQYGDTMRLSLVGDDSSAVTLTNIHYNRLKALYNGQDFDRHLFCMLRRYETMFGDTGPFEGTGHHAALPSRVLTLLKRLFGVEMECFASPLNSCFRYYCSAFLDTDAAFGSLGSFFDLEMIRGSFEANPPLENQPNDYHGFSDGNAPSQGRQKQGATQFRYSCATLG